VLPSLPDSKPQQNSATDSVKLPDTPPTAASDSTVDGPELPQRLATAASDGTVKLWNLRAGQSADGRCATARLAL
jgi:WD40 repeat protein